MEVVSRQRWNQLEHRGMKHLLARFPIQSVSDELKGHSRLNGGLVCCCSAGGLENICSGLERVDGDLTSAIRHDLPLWSSHASFLTVRCENDHRVSASWSILGGKVQGMWVAKPFPVSELSSYLVPFSNSCHLELEEGIPEACAIAVEAVV